MNSSLIKRSNRLTKRSKRSNRLTKRSNRLTKRRLTKRSNRLTKRSNRLTKRNNRLTKRSKRSNRLTKRSNRLSKRSNRLSKRSKRSKRSNRLSKRNNRLSKRSKKVLGGDGEWTSVDITGTDYEESFMPYAPKTVYYTINISKDGISHIIRVRFSDILQLQTTLLDLLGTLSCLEHHIRSEYMKGEIIPLINKEFPLYQSIPGVKRELTPDELKQRKTHIIIFLNNVRILLNKFINVSLDNDIGENCQEYFKVAFDDFLKNGRNQWVSKKKSTADWGQAYDNLKKNL